jgi:class 3 adenylate cyclase
MIASTTRLNTWLRHKAGLEPILNTGGVRDLNESVELNQDGEQIISSFGNREFEAMVGFIDMRGFSNAAKGKTPIQVRDIVAPFISAVVEVATDHDCFIDKSIGDEVMVVMPWFERDTVLSDTRLPNRQIPEIDLSSLFADLIRNLSKRTPDIRFSAGFAFGRLVLARIGAEDYGEWTVYGNCVNTAKRLQARQADEHWAGKHIIALGALESEKPDYRKELETWIKVIEPAGGGPLKFFSPIVDTEDFKGVGSASFVHSAIEIRPECK